MSLRRTFSRVAALAFLLAALTLTVAAPPPVQGAEAVTLIGKAAPELVLKGADGKDFRLSSLRGKVVFLEFWATWCSDCKKVLPDVQALFTKYKGKGLEVVTVSVDVKTRAVQPFMKEKGYTFPALLADRKAEELRKTFLVQRIPTLWLIDRTGVVRAGYVEYGKKGASEVEARIVQLLGE